MKPIAILHEGNTGKSEDNRLLKQLLDHLNLNTDKIDFYGFGPKSNFFDATYAQYLLTLIPRVKADQIQKVLFVVDADNSSSDARYGGAENTRNELTRIISELGLEHVSEIYISCDPDTQSGYIESLILATIPDQQKDCIESFLRCSNFQSKENHKAILNSIYKMAYPNAPYDFSHRHFDELKQKLSGLFDGI